MLPEFDLNGLLPAGDYQLTLAELRDSMLVHGRKNPPSPTWDSEWRKKLVDNLEVMAKQLWTVGVEKIFVNGSFVENKDHPNDIDGYFECGLADLASGRLEQELNLLDPHKAWTWDLKSRIHHPDSGKSQLPMWHIYRVELYPHFGQSSGIKDSAGHELLFPSAFRQSRREGRPKGIIRLLKSITA